MPKAFERERSPKHKADHEAELQRAEDESHLDQEAKKQDCGRKGRRVQTSVPKKLYLQLKNCLSGVCSMKLRLQRTNQEKVKERTLFSNESKRVDQELQNELLELESIRDQALEGP